MTALLGRAALLLLAGGMLGAVINRARPDGIGLTAASGATSANSCTPPAGSAALPPDVPPVQVMPPAEAVTLCGDPRTLLADVRHADQFAHGHVSGAIHLPCAASGTAAAAAVDLLAGRTTLIVYGNGTDDAKVVAEELRARSARGGRPDVRVLVLAGGFPAWDQAGLACSSGPCPDCQATPGHR